MQKPLMQLMQQPLMQKPLLRKPPLRKPLLRTLQVALECGSAQRH